MSANCQRKPSQRRRGLCAAAQPPAATVCCTRVWEKLTLLPGWLASKCLALTDREMLSSFASASGSLDSSSLWMTSVR